MMKRILLPTLVFLITQLSLNAQIVTNYALGDGFTVLASDSSFSTTISGRFQTLFESEAQVGSGFELGDFETSTAVRRARLDIKGFLYDPSVRYKFELGFSELDRTVTGYPGANNMVLDAYVGWKFWRGFELIFGQARLPGNRERVVASNSMQLVDRSLASAHFNLDRDLGMQLRHQHQVGRMIVRESLAATQGEGRNALGGNQGGYQYTGRLEVLPMGKFTNDGDTYYADLEHEPDPKLAIGITGNFNDNAVRERGNQGTVFATERDLTTLIADALFKYRGWCAASEFFYRTTESPIFYSRDAPIVEGIYNVGMGTMAQVGYLTNSSWEFTGRFTWVEPERITERDVVRQYTAGISRYISRHNLKVQGDASWSYAGTNDPTLGLRFQVEAGF